MTNPVLAAVAERQGYIISFVMPPKFSLENLPEPFNKRIYLRDITAHKAAVFKFHGNLDETVMAKKTAEIEVRLTHNELYHKPSFTFAQYNFPGIPPVSATTKSSLIWTSRYSPVLFFTDKIHNNLNPDHATTGKTVAQLLKSETIYTYKSQLDNPWLNGLLISSIRRNELLAVPQNNDSQ